MPASGAFKAQVGDLLGFMPELTVKRMFGGAGVCSCDLMFALIIDDELFLKTDDVSRALFVAEGCGPWTYERGGEARDTGYYRAPDIVWDDPDEARRWAEIAFASALRRRKPPKSKPGARVAGRQRAG